MVTRARRLLVAALVAAGTLTGCGGTPEPSYAPVPDARLYARIDALPGVQKVDIRWVDTVDNGNTYLGDVQLRRGVDPLRRLDQVLAILRQGRPEADMAVHVGPRDSLQRDPGDLGIFGPDQLEKRYGPQPGDGKPPDSTPSPR